MPVYGNLGTMSLSDLLTWGAANEKTGVLELERNKSCRRIEFRKGWIGACSSDEPTSRIGQFLLSRGKISVDQLQEGLKRQEGTHKRLGLVLVEMGVIPASELSRQISAKAEEIVHGLFDWEDALFRFYEGATLDPDQIEVNLSVRQVLESGKQRAHELALIRRTFQSGGIVLGRVGAEVPVALANRPLTRKIYESIDGLRTLSEILLHARASEFLVLRFLYELHRRGFVEIIGCIQRVPDAPSLLDVTQRGGLGLGMRRDPEDERQMRELWEAVGHELIAAHAQRSPAPAEDPSPPPVSKEGFDLELIVARRLISRGEHETALELLNAIYRANPGQPSLRNLILDAELTFIERVSKNELSLAKIPVLHCVDSEVLNRLGSEASYLLTLIDGQSDVRSLLWLAPLRKADALRTLRQMVMHGLIELRDPPPGGLGAGLSVIPADA